MSESSPDPDPTPAVDEAAPEAEVFLNRAERRAKGKKGGHANVNTDGRQPVGRGSVQSPRQYGNRRSG